MNHGLTVALVAALAAGAAHAQPNCPEAVEVRVDASLLPDRQAIVVHAQWLVDWRGAVSNPRVDNVVTGPARPRGELHPQLRRAIQHAIEQQVRCTARAQGESESLYPFVRDVTVRPSV